MICHTAVAGFVLGGSPKPLARSVASWTPALKSENLSALLSQCGKSFFRCSPTFVALLNQGHPGFRWRTSQTSKQGCERVSHKSSWPAASEIADLYIKFIDVAHDPRFIVRVICLDFRGTPNHRRWSTRFKFRCDFVRSDPRFVF